MIPAESTDRISAIRTSLKVNQWLGFWKWNDRKRNWGALQRIYFLALHLPLTFIYIALMWFELLTSHNLVQAGNVLYMSLTELALIVKLFNIWNKREQAWQFIEELDQNDIYSLRNENEVLLWQREQSQFKRIFYTYYLVCFIVAVTGYLSVLYQNEYALPFSYYVPFEWRNSQNYFYAWSYNVLAMSVCCASNTLLDTTGCYFIFHIGLLYRLLSLRLNALQNTLEPEAVPKIHQVFLLHQRVRHLTQQCERLISLYVLAQIVLSALIICFSGYRIVQMNWQQNPGPFLTTVQFVAVMIVQIYLPCYYGNQLTVHAHQLTNSAFNINWLDYSVPTRKLLNCYMEFIKQPVKTRAGGFFEIGLPIFMKSINNAYSFFALLLNLSS